MNFRKEYREGDLRIVEWFAPAKVNICLHILGKRGDGYHDLQSLMVPLSLGDLLTLKFFPAFKNEKSACHLRVIGADLPQDSQNLALCAAQKFSQAFCQLEKSLGKIEIVLEKKIPIAAGLGGGSSDAAAVLLACNFLLGEPFSKKELMNLAQPLGADVPFFILQQTAWARGIGEILTPLKTSLKYWFVLVNPNFSVSTAWVYQNLDLNLTSKTLGETMGNPEKWFPTASWPDLLRNDLETVTLKAHPDLQDIKDQLISFGAKGALMSGSGPTVFGIFSGNEGEKIAQKASENLAQNKNWKVFTACNI